MDEFRAHRAAPLGQRGSATNNTALPAWTICALYKSRWQVELVFMWIKEHLRIKPFLGNDENAVNTQAGEFTLSRSRVCARRSQTHEP